MKSNVGAIDVVNGGSYVMECSASPLPPLVGATIGNEIEPGDSHVEFCGDLATGFGVPGGLELGGGSPRSAVRAKTVR